MSASSNYVVLLVAFAALLFDGMELGLMPVASLSITRNLLGSSFTHKIGAEWFAYFTAALMLGAAVGGIWLGSLGDKIGRTRALGISVLFYSVFAGLGALADNLWQMLLLRFAVGLGVGGVWPNAVALVAECWPKMARPLVAGIVGAGLNFGIVVLSQLVKHFTITPEHWRWIFGWSAAPAVLGLLCLTVVPESPAWREQKSQQAKPATPLADLFSPQLRSITYLGILLGAVPLVGAWAASKWMLPWAEQAAGSTNPGYKASVQAWWAIGATLGSFTGAQIAGWLGFRKSYLCISIGALVSTASLFLWNAPLRPGFLWGVGLQGFLGTLFFGWLPLYLPQLFPINVRAAGTGVAYNSGRFLTAAMVFLAGGLASLLGGHYAKIGAICSLIYGLGILLACFLPKALITAKDS
jgi:predicted MFS family arabinose efflux permease